MNGGAAGHSRLPRFLDLISDGKLLFTLPLRRWQQSRQRHPTINGFGGWMHIRRGTGTRGLQAATILSILQIDKQIDQ